MTFRFIIVSIVGHCCLFWIIKMIDDEVPHERVVSFVDIGALAIHYQGHTALGANTVAHRKSGDDSNQDGKSNSDRRTGVSSSYDGNDLSQPSKPSASFDSIQKSPKLSLKISLEKTLRSGGISHYFESEANSISGFDSDSARDVGKNFAESIELPRPLEELWRRVRLFVYFHPDFFIEHIQGVVKAQVVIDEWGRIELLRSVDGPHELSEWVKMGLYNALGRDVLRNKLSKRQALELIFNFRIVYSPPPVESYSFKGRTLTFDIFGYSPPQQTMDNLAGRWTAQKKMFRESEWSFSKKIEPYIRACLSQNNKLGCEYLIKAYSQVGMKKEQSEIQKQLDMLSKM